MGERCTPTLHQRVQSLSESVYVQRPRERRIASSLNHGLDVLVGDRSLSHQYPKFGVAKSGDKFCCRAVGPTTKFISALSNAKNLVLAEYY